MGSSVGFSLFFFLSSGLQLCCYISLSSFLSIPCMSPLLLNFILCSLPPKSPLWRQETVIWRVCSESGCRDGWRLWLIHIAQWGWGWEHTVGPGHVCKLFSKCFRDPLGPRAAGADSTQSHRTKQEDKKEGRLRTRKNSENISGSDKHEDWMERNPNSYKGLVSSRSIVSGF